MRMCYFIVIANFRYITDSIFRYAKHSYLMLFLIKVDNIIASDLECSTLCPFFSLPSLSSIPKNKIDIGCFSGSTFESLKVDFR